jgi:hypothetical protein
LLCRSSSTADDLTRGNGRHRVVGLAALEAARMPRIGLGAHPVLRASKLGLICVCVGVVALAPAHAKTCKEAIVAQARSTRS